ncbi:MAG TPA: hypothetical protein VKV77_05745 [Methylovirgula sp.]|nr:hypothetical protein [Methylovirgula sp.]
MIAKSGLLRSSGLALLGAFALGSFVAGDSAPVRAQFGIINGILGGGGFGGGGGYYHRGYGHRHYSNRASRPHREETDSSDSEASGDSSRESNRALANLAPPSSRDQSAVLKSISMSETLVEVGTSDDDQLTGKTFSSEADRDYTSKIDQLIQKIQTNQDSHQNKEGDVTEHAILEALTDAIIKTKLARFETFLGENWSAERLRVMILDHVYRDIDGFFAGTKGAIAMSDLTTMINKAAREVYVQLFETSELLAANRGSTLFLQRLYQSHGDLKDNVREDTEQFLIEASSAGTSSFDPLFRRDLNSYALRYRAERIIFDCLSDNVDSITASNSGMASTAAIEKRLLEVDRQQCSKWVANQMIGADKQLKPQDPMPLRVIWSADGPKDDPSMYGHASDS